MSSTHPSAHRTTLPASSTDTMTGPSTTVDLITLPGSTRAVLLLCAQAGLVAAVRPIRNRTGSGFVAWLLAEDPAAGFGFLTLDVRGRVLALQLFGGLCDRRLRPDPILRAEASAATFRAAVTAVVAYRKDRRRTGPQDAAAAVPGVHPDLLPTTTRRCRRAA